MTFFRKQKKRLLISALTSIMLILLFSIAYAAPLIDDFSTGAQTIVVPAGLL